MIGAIVSAAFNFILNGIVKLFGVNRDEQIGSLKESNKNQERTIEDATKANDLHNRVDTMSDADRKRLSDDLNQRD